MTEPGVIHGVGLGPGDPELMTVRADRLVRAARVVAYFRKRGNPGQARRIVEGLLHAQAQELAMEYPVTTELPPTDPAYVDQLRPFYDHWADRLAALSAAGREIVVLCEGDPFFYGSFMHLFSRLADRAPVKVTPGVTGMSGCWTASGKPITYGDDVLTVLPGTMDEASLSERMRGADALVVMKLGRNLPKVRRALASAGLLDRAVYVERGQMPGQIVAPLAAKADDSAPYFSMVLVHGEGRRP
jgi:precorrin-2/cobalt-factor-2 C20-methyltransferase